MRHSIDAPQWALEWLRKARIARLGTASSDGRPLVVPVCYALDGPSVVTIIDSKPKATRRLRRLRNLEENPQASFLVDHYDEDWRRLRYVHAWGRARIRHEGSEFDRAVELLLAKYAQYREMGLDDAGPVIDLIPESVHCWRWE